MSNSLNSSGLTIATQSELLANFTTAFQQIYGSEIVLTSDSPDGQLINIFIQADLDTLDLISQVYSSFDPNQAVGNILDQRVAINGITRQAGTFTITPITVVTSTSVNLYGLDQSSQPVYTVSDAAGNQWQLQVTQLGASGTQIFNFQAANPGAVTTITNTIVVQVTVVLGVTSVNNPTTYSSLGVNEESDAALRIRRSKSVAIGSQGYLGGLYAALANVTGVTSAFVYENNTGTTDSDGVPGHSIWVIVAGSATAANIANAIYIKRNAGCGMFGAQTYTIVQVDGTSFTVSWDDVSEQNLFIQFTATSLNGTTAPAIQEIVADLPTTFVPNVFQEVNINALATDVQQIDSNTLVTNAGFSNGKIQILTLSGTAASGSFKIDYNGSDSSTIQWNDTASTIQSDLRTLTGDSGLTVTGSATSSPITVTFSTTTNVLALLYAKNNSLMTSGPVAIAFTYNEGYANTLTPTSKKNQFLVSSSNIVVIPLLITPANPITAPLGIIDFVTNGGYGVYTYSLSTNNSGGSINSSTGVYTAGSSGLVNDVAKVVDSLGNSQTISITVT